jgi:hypothetical protein
MLRLVVGGILIVIGLSALSPLDELLFVLPLSLVFGAWIIPLWTGIAILCLGLGVYLAGRSKWIPNPIANHIWVFVSIGVAICAYFFMVLW